MKPLPRAGMGFATASRASGGCLLGLASGGFLASGLLEVSDLASEGAGCPSGPPSFASGGGCLIEASGFVSGSFLASAGFLLGLSGFAAGGLEIDPFGLGGGGLFGGVSLEEDLGPVGLLSDSATGSTLSFLMILLRTCGSGVKLLILIGGGGFGFGVLVWTGPALSVSERVGVGAPTGLEGVLGCSPKPTPGERGVASAFGVVSAFMVFVRGDIFLVGGGGRGMLGGGGIIRLVGLFTFFILALALGGGTGVPVGVSSLAASNNGVLSSGLAGSRAFLAVAASSRAGGTGGGGRRRGFERLCTAAAVVRRFGSLGFGAGGSAASGGGSKGAPGSVVSTVSTSGFLDGSGMFDEVGVLERSGEG